MDWSSTHLWSKAALVPKARRSVEQRGHGDRQRSQEGSQGLALNTKHRLMQSAQRMAERMGEDGHCVRKGYSTY